MISEITGDDYQLPKVSYVKILPSSDIVKGRFSHSATQYNNKIYIFGGAVERGEFGIIRFDSK